MDIELCSTTRIEYIDDLLRGLVSLFEMSFPGRIRSYYLSGSYSGGTAVGHDRSPNSSDVDLLVIFRGKIEEAEETVFHRLLSAAQLISPVPLDANAYSEDDLLQQPRKGALQTTFNITRIKIASLFIYGEDIRPVLPEVLFSRYVLDVIESGVFHLGIPRQSRNLTYPLGEPLTYPLAYPNANGEFYGYDLVPARPGTPSGIRVLVDITAWIATLILALETGRYAGQKSQSIQLCKTYLPDDKRAQLATSIYDLKGTWGYTIPDIAEERERLRSLCRNTLALENDYLKLCRDYMLTQLQHSRTEEKLQAARILQSVVYPNDEIVAALKALAYDIDEEVQAGAAKALEISERSVKDH